MLTIINTGTIGKYVAKWGTREMTYLKHKYLCPIVRKHEFFGLFRNTYAKKSVVPKIILKGLTLLDACLDAEGNIIPGKSTLIIANNDLNELKFLLSIINSRLAFFYIKEKYPASSYNEGINFTKDMIDNFPIPQMSKAEKNTLIEFIDKIMKIAQSENYWHDSEKQTKVKDYQRQIDQIVYKLYGLTDEDIKIIEQSLKG